MIKRNLEQSRRFLEPESGYAAVKYFNKFSKFFKLPKMNVSNKNAS